MKGCFVLQRRFLYVGHELAKLLKERGVVEDFCAFIQVRDGYEYLRTQKDIPYSALLLDEDVFKAAKGEAIDYDYLKNFEREYGVLWKYINVDRVLRLGQLVREYPHDRSPYSHEELLQILQAYAKRIGAFLDGEKPDFVYMFQPGGLATLLLYDMAEKRGIPVFTTLIPSMRNLIVVSESYHNMTGVEKLFRENLKKESAKVARYEEAKAYIEEFRKKPIPYSSVVVGREKSGRLRQFSFLLPRNLYHTLHYNFFEIFRQWWRDPKKRTDYTTINPFLHLYDRAKRKVRNLVGLSDLYDRFDPSQRLAFYPLQYEPEMGILMSAPFDTDQIQIIRRIAQSLPVEMNLYVKEHPTMVSYRPRRYYEELKKIPNVRLIDPNIPGAEVVKHASLVASINSSAAWEGALFGKPVITFGDAFFNALSSVERSRTPEELPALVKKQLKKGGCPEEELVRFVAAILEDAASADLMYLWEVEHNLEKKREGLKGLADVLARKIQARAKSNV